MSTRVSVILAAGVLIGAFFGGVVLGRSAQEKPKPMIARTSVTTDQVPEVKEELAECQEELAALSMPATRSSAADRVPEEAKRAIAAEEAKEEVLENELRQCRKRDLFFNVDLCLASDRYAFPLLLPVLAADQKCVDTPGVGDLIVKHSEHCAMFEDQRGPEELDIGELSGTELSNLYRAQQFGRRVELPGGDRIANLARGIKRMARQCRKKYGLSDE